MKRPTQSDVANLAGVSRATVSYIVNNRMENGRVSITDKTRRKVLDAVDRLGYEPDERARTLKSGDTNTLGLLIPDTFNPHYWAIAHGVQEEAARAGYGLGLYSSKLDPEREIKTLTDLLRMRVDGLIIIPSFFEEAEQILTRLVHQRRPVVVLGQSAFDLDTVTPSTDLGMRTLVNHLQSLGHQQIGFINGISSPHTGAVRLRTFLAAMTEGNQSVSKTHIIRCGSSIQDGYSATQQILTQPSPPTAIIILNDMLAVGALRATIDLGLSVPEDVSIASFDNTFMASYTVPRLTTVETNAVEIGRSGVQLVIARMQNASAPIEKIHIPAELIVRESTGPVTK